MKNKSFEEKVKVYREVALHYGRDKTAFQLRQELGLTKQELSNIAFMLRKAGVDIPRLKEVKGTAGGVIKKLESDCPELFRKVRTSSSDRISRILSNRS